MTYTLVPISNGSPANILSASGNYVYNSVTFSMNAAGQSNTNTGINSVILGGANNTIEDAPTNSFIAASDSCTTDSMRSAILFSENSDASGIGSGCFGCFNCTITGDHNLCLSTQSNLNGDRNIALGGSGQIIIGDDNVTFGQNSQVTGDGSFCASGVGFGSNALTTSNAASFAYPNGIVMSNIASQQPVASAVLTLNSTIKGFLPPRQTTVQKNAISSPATGLMLYDTTTNKPNYYDGTAWQTLSGALLPASTHLIYVSPQGSNTTGTGTLLQPFKTIAQAQTLVTGTTIKYTILLMPGTYTENVHLKPNVFLLGYNPDQCLLTGTLDINDALWSTGSGFVSGCENLRTTGVITADFSTHTVTNGQFIFIGGVTGNSVTIKGYSSTNQAIFFNNLILSTVTINGANFICIGVPQNFSPLFTVNSDPTVSASIVYDGAAIGGDWDINYTAGHAAVSVYLACYDQIGTITINASTGSAGGSINLAASANSLLNPIVYMNDGAIATQLNFLTQSRGIGYAPTTPADWTVQPTTVEEALDMIAAKIGPV